MANGRLGPGRGNLSPFGGNMHNQDLGGPGASAGGTGGPEGPVPSSIPRGSQYGPDGLLDLNDLDNPNLSLTDRHYLAGLGYTQNPNDPAAKTNYDNWTAAMKNQPGAGSSGLGGLMLMGNPVVGQAVDLIHSRNNGMQGFNPGPGPGFNPGAQRGSYAQGMQDRFAQSQQNVQGFKDALAGLKTKAQGVQNGPLGRLMQSRQSTPKVF